jgi:ABC-type branched-subunit amino acid transport system ATPase component/ABC-type branched-subunit amino acid transport system permease subunit
MMSALLDQYSVTLEFSAAFALFALSTYVALRGGILSLAAVPLAAVTGFLSLVLIEDHGLAIEWVLIIGALAGIAAALVASFPLLRLDSHWVALASIAFVLMARVVVLNLDSVTRGAVGAPITRTIRPWHLIVVLLAVSWVMSRHRRSRLGLAAEAIRTYPDVAASLGIDVIVTRRSLWMVSGALAGLAGVVYANLVQFLSPDTFYVNVAFVMLAAVVLGGAHHWFGALVGALVFTLLPDVLRQYLDGGEQIVNGVLLIAIMIFMPRGLVDPTRKVRRRLARTTTNTHLPTDTHNEGDKPPDADTEMWDLRLSGKTVEGISGRLSERSAIEVRDLRKMFGGLVAIDELTFSVPEQSVFGVVGPNGAGKSTLLAMMSGAVVPDSGSITLFGEDITGCAPVAVARRRVARTYQTVQLFEDLTVLENILVGFDQQRVTNFWDPVLITKRSRAEQAELEDRARALMDRVGVIGQPDQYAATLSYANQRRVEIARALASDPQVLLLDEPTAGMHKLGTQAVGELLLELREQGLTLVVIEHNLELVLNYCQRSVVMDFGQLLCEGLPAECLANPDVIEAYFGRKADAERIESLIALRQHPGSSSH